MNIKKTAWHARAFKWMEPDNHNPTVCHYWGTVWVGIPTCSVLFALFSPILLGVWLGGQIQERFHLKILSVNCPFGHVDFEE